MAYPLNDLGSALRAQLYHTVMGGDEKVPPPANTFFTWCMPGIATAPEAFDFAAEGLWTAPTAEEAKRRMQQAFNFSQLVDFIPDVAGAYSNDRQEGMFRPNAEEHLSEMYGQIIRFSKVVAHELTAEEETKLEKFRKLLFAERTEKNLVTDEETQVTVPGPVLEKYNAMMKAYVDAALEYNAKRVAAAAATGESGRAAVADFQLNAQLYYLKVKAAMDNWVAGGYRNDVDAMNAWINQTTQRSMGMWKQRLLESFDRGKLTGSETDLPFYYSTVIPGDFATSDGWTSFSVTHESVEWGKKNSADSWNLGAKVALGLWSIGPEASGSKSELDENREVGSFKLSMELTQALIVRPWFYPEWFANRGWVLRKGEGWNYDEPPSNGSNPPSGKFIGYPTSALFVRNLEIESSELASAYAKAQSELGANATIGWGPFKLSGGYQHASGEEKFSSTSDGSTLRAPGMQIIGFVNHLIGKAPDPLPELRPEDFQ